MKFILTKPIWKKSKLWSRKGIIFTAVQNSVYLEDSPSYAKEIYDLGIPVLGICYGSQLMMHQLGGKVMQSAGSRIW